MGQFGMSSSPLDVQIHALGRIAPDSPALLRKLQQLKPDHEFSHFRAICLVFIRNPDAKAAAKLEELLFTPGMSGYAIRNFKDTLLANRALYNDTSVRNSQLKELYLAKALCRCNPQHKEAQKILSDYAHGLMGYYAIFARS